MMSLFTPPTDNLYKFVALSGIVLIVAGLTIPPVFFHQTGMEYLAQLHDSKEFEVQEKFVNERLPILDGRKEQVLNQKDNLQQRLDRLKSASPSTEVDKVEGQIKEANHEIEKIEDSSHELTLNLELKRAQIKYEETVSANRLSLSRLFLMLGFGAVIFGICISILGFTLWYKKLQRYQDRKVTEEAKIKSADDSTDEQNKPPEPAPHNPS